MLQLPALSWRASPNYSSRNGARVRLVVCHDCEGNYDGSISWFSSAKSQVSAHVVLSKDGTQATQMVAWANKGWHACAFNSVSEGIEAAGYAAKGLGAPEWRALAAVVAFRLKANGLPPRWARDGAGEGVAQHRDLGAAGGGHFDISADPAIWNAFVAMVQEAYAEPMPASWLPGGIPAYVQPPSGWTPHPDVRHDLEPRTIAWAQARLNALDVPAPFPLMVDGMDGPNTYRAVRSFQSQKFPLAVDGVLGPETYAALEKANL
jgi:hypothetical protein